MTVESFEPWEGALPCPFCGGAAQLILTEAGHEGSGITSAACVVCSKCDAGGPMFEPVARDVPIEIGRRVALRKWNKRGSAQGAEWKLSRIAAVLNSTYPGGELREAGE